MDKSYIHPCTAAYEELHMYICVSFWLDHRWPLEHDDFKVHVHAVLLCRYVCTIVHMNTQSTHTGYIRI